MLCYGPFRLKMQRAWQGQSDIVCILAGFRFVAAALLGAAAALLAAAAPAAAFASRFLAAGFGCTSA